MIDSSVVDGVGQNLGVEELDEITAPILDLVTGLLNTVIGLVTGLLSSLSGGLGL